MISFTKDIEIGVAEIDEQHKELINRINAVSAAGVSSTTKEETEKTLKLLSDYVVKHFSDEEELQRKCGYPKCEWHKQQHSIFIKEIQNMSSEYLQNGPSAKFTLSLNKSIIDWIVKHIKYTDLEIAKYCKG